MHIFLVYPLLGVAGLAVAVIIAVIASRNFYGVILLILVFSLIMPLVARFGPNVLASVQSIAKLGILGMGVVIWFIPFLLSRRLRLNQVMRWFAVAILISFSLFLFRSLIDLRNGVSFQNILSSFQVFGFAYCLLAVVIYDQTKDLKWLPKFLWFLVVSGIVVAAFGVFQWVMGPEWLQARGMNLGVGSSSVGIADYHFLSYSDQQLFRVFSTLGNHGDLAAFMVLTILAVLALYWMRRLTLALAFPAAGLMGLALLATRNNTGLVVLGGALVLAVWQANRYAPHRHPNPSRLSRPTLIFILLVILVIGLVLINSEIRFRVISSFTLGNNNPSLVSRIEILETSLATFFAHPFGLGFDPSLLPYQVTLDVYLIFLLVTGGPFIFAFYIWLYILPPLFGWRSLRKLRTQERSLYVFYCVLWAWITAGALIGGFTNSAVTTSNPSNLLYWCGAGLLLKIPVLVAQSSQARPAERGSVGDLLLNRRRPNSPQVELVNGETI